MSSPETPPMETQEQEPEAQSFDWMAREAKKPFGPKFAATLEDGTLVKGETAAEVIDKIREQRESGEEKRNSRLETK